MTEPITLNFLPEEQAEIQRQANRRGVSLEEYIVFWTLGRDWQRMRWERMGREQYEGQRPKAEATA